MSAHPGELGSTARRWFEIMRQSGDEVRELVHDGCPVACLGDAPFGYVNVFTSHVNVGFFHGASLPDPGNRLVADELECRWNHALAGVRDIEQRIAHHDGVTRAEPVPCLADFTALAERLEALWAQPETDQRLKKRVVRALIQMRASTLTASRVSGAVWVLFWPRRRRGTRSSVWTPPIQWITSTTSAATASTSTTISWPRRSSSRPRRWHSNGGSDPSSAPVAHPSRRHWRLACCAAASRTWRRRSSRRTACASLVARLEVAQALAYAGVAWWAAGRFGLIGMAIVWTGRASVQMCVALLACAASSGADSMPSVSFWAIRLAGALVLFAAGWRLSAIPAVWLQAAALPMTLAMFGA